MKSSRSAFTLLSLLALAGTADRCLAGAIVTLIPEPTSQIYAPGQTVRINVLAQLTTDPQEPESIRLRLAQFDVGASDPRLALMPVVTHPATDLDPISFWDFQSVPACAGNPADCGTNYYLDDSISDDEILNITYLGLTTSGTLQVTLRQAAPLRIGVLDVILPDQPGSFLLDLFNAGATPDIGESGAQMRHYFGVLPYLVPPWIPGDGLTGGEYTFTVVPEPATLLSVGTGVTCLASGRRRRPS
jgi:hypothetical protein